MHVPVIAGTIDRRILANWRCDPKAVAALLPPPFRPKLAGDGRHAMVGICLIRLANVRPRGLPRAVGIGSENAAHRIAVEWDASDGTVREGVYVSRRDTSSRLNTLLGGRLFPGVHNHARFDVREDGRHLHVAMESDDGITRVSIDATVADALPTSSVFSDVRAASAFFEAGSHGFSPGREAGKLDGLELRTLRWDVEPLAVERAQSSYFDDPERFPRGTATFDCALLMRKIEHEWHDSAAPACAVCIE